MNAKKIVRTLLLSIVCLGFALVGYQQFGASVFNASENIDVTTTVSPKLKDGLNVYYFYGNQRCTTCVRMEKFTQKTLMENFLKEVRDGEMQLNLVNVDLAENQHYIEDYELIFRSVVISTSKDGVETEWRRLDKIWELANNEVAFQQYLTEEIEAILGQTHG
ncbi:nitrophenyl compound nitroreductase subunit ArsF family protein [Shewanella putrefaciens]|uniref:Uncharacterized protein n=1 Tax=Shewanella putrefaciens TaxID=24 RepID=A0ABX8XF80_SHEPU|nr:nitrophenyl compound nitroreductase subunit ArsF family protein [Shewanella putrefaciens]CAD6366865.1 hypothetical protein SHEWT2_01322 [Shewanella hafniensis]AVV83215.1 hypothetical protein SPWS13_1406 [Shewanella putrefaciens]MCT8942471.1 nitrophenyl compound nitroreductase subunit ArsF family protein [Shewanella putrefaciens]QSE50495.1 hypothetical protein JW975_05680 [Shewanella putrefaciens]QYX73905.1 hypothetical protein K3G22_05670 [Shewanella putrefaciens]